MEEKEIELARDLLEETIAWARTGDLAAGLQCTPQSLSYKYNWNETPIQITNVQEWKAATNPKTKEVDTVYLTLCKELTDGQSIYFAITNYASDALKNLVNDSQNQIRRAVADSKYVTRLADELAGFTMYCDDAVKYVAGIINNHLSYINEMRVASLSRRYVLTEALFCAYRHGLFPFGWDYKSLWCLNPKDLHLPGPISRTE